MTFQRLILFCVLLFAGFVDKLIEDRWHGHVGTGMVGPHAIQVDHSFLALGSPHRMVVVKTWPYSGKKLAVCRVCVVSFLLLLFIVRLLPSHSYVILVMPSTLASCCGEALHSGAYLLHVSCAPGICSLWWCYYTWTMVHIYAAFSLSSGAILTMHGGLAGLCLGAIVRPWFVLCLSRARH